MAEWLIGSDYIIEVQEVSNPKRTGWCSSGLFIMTIMYRKVKVSV